MEKPRSNPAALLPIGVFLVLFIGSGIVFHDFYAMPIVGGRSIDIRIVPAEPQALL